MNLGRRVKVRAVGDSDLPALQDIYNYAVESTSATMDTECRTPEQMRHWLEDHRGDRYIARVAEVDGIVSGYGCLSPFASRGGYQASCEVSVYLRPESQGRGVGSLLLRELTEHALRVGFTTVMGFATQGNTRSVRMMQSLGYEHVGILRDAASKHGQLVSLSIWQKLPPQGGTGGGSE